MCRLCTALSRFCNEICGLSKKGCSLAPSVTGLLAETCVKDIYPYAPNVAFTETDFVRAQEKKQDQKFMQSSFVRVCDCATSAKSRPRTRGFFIWAYAKRVWVGGCTNDCPETGSAHLCFEFSIAREMSAIRFGTLNVVQIEHIESKLSNDIRTYYPKDTGRHTSAPPTLSSTQRNAQPLPAWRLESLLTGATTSIQIQRI